MAFSSTKFLFNTNHDDNRATLNLITPSSYILKNFSSVIKPNLL